MRTDEERETQAKRGDPGIISPCDWGTRRRERSSSCATYPSRREQCGGDRTTSDESVDKDIGVLSDSRRAEVIALFPSDVFASVRPWVPPVQGQAEIHILIFRKQRRIINLGFKSRASNCTLENIFAELKKFDMRINLIAGRLPLVWNQEYRDRLYRLLIQFRCI